MERARSNNTPNLDLRLTHFLTRPNQPPFTYHNAVSVLQNGVETFPSIFEAISEAKHHVHLEYYTIENDQIGNQLRQLLIDKAQQGVQVRVLYDAIGSNRLKPTFIESLKLAGVEIAAFLPIRFPFPSSKINYHDHRKMVIVDGQVGFIGGLNFGDQYMTGGKHFASWRDTHLRIAGEAVYLLQELFFTDWGFVTGRDLITDDYFPVCSQAERCWVQVTPNGPAAGQRLIYESFFEFITHAEKRVYITTPYFIPEDALVAALASTALSGVDVRILLPHFPDRRIVQWAGRSYYDRLLKAGVKIYEYHAGFLHAKVLLVDDAISSVGTANLDIRSMEINFEVNAMIYDSEICRKLTNDFFADLKQSLLISSVHWNKRSLAARFAESFARLF
ncbi:MAG: clsA, partial [Bacilli bacterium]|nr:clsA [Bacilli bacterium]